MLKWNLKGDSVTLLITLIIFIFIVWFMVSQPTLVAQSDKQQTTYIKSENLKKLVYTMVERFDGRSYNNIEMLDATADYIHTEFSKYSDDVVFQNFKTSWFLGDEVYPYKNVIATFKGTESCESEIVVVGGHYDTFGGYAGANDNTSAVAGLLELARVLGEHPPKCTTQLVAYVLEEPPAFGTEKMGSFIHAKRLKDQGVKVKVAIVLDMIGFYSEEPNSQSYPIPLMKLYYPAKANYISVVSDFSNILRVREAKNSLKQTSNLPVYSINAPAFIPGIDFSDHRNYWKFGYPALMITDTAFYRSSNYHTKNDTPDTLDYEKISKVIEGVLQMLGVGQK